MQSNVGRTDRLIRTALAFVCIFGSIYWGVWLAVAGIIVLITAMIAWCPIYAAFHLATAREQEKIPVDTSGQHHPRYGPERRFK